MSDTKFLRITKALFYNNTGSSVERDISFTEDDYNNVKTSEIFIPINKVIVVYKIKDDNLSNRSIIKLSTLMFGCDHLSTIDKIYVFSDDYSSLFH